MSKKKRTKNGMALSFIVYLMISWDLAVRWSSWSLASVITYQLWFSKVTDWILWIFVDFGPNGWVERGCWNSKDFVNFRRCGLVYTNCIRSKIMIHHDRSWYEMEVKHCSIVHHVESGHDTCIPWHIFLSDESVSFDTTLWLRCK